MEEFLITSFIENIDNKNVKEIENIIRTNENKDFVLEIYDNALLTSGRLQFVLENCSKFLKISLILIRRLLKENNFELLDIIFNYIKFFGTDFILDLLNRYKNKISISTSVLNQQIDKYKISTVKDEFVWDNYYDSSNIYFVNACEYEKEDLLKYLYEQLKIDIKSICGRDDETLLFIACKNRNLILVKYLIELGLDINKENDYGETPFFNACESRNLELVKYLIKCGIDISKSNYTLKTPLFYACESENVDIVKYLIKFGANINQEDDEGETPIFEACFNEKENIVKCLVELGIDINKEKRLVKHHCLKLVAVEMKI